MPITLLSVIPHQEPRFIIPIVLPLVFLYAPIIKPPDTVMLKRQRERISVILQSNKTKFINFGKIWFVCNAVFVIFYGFLHQGGVLPMTSHLAQELRTKPFHTKIHVITSHTYSIPTGLLHLRNTQRVYRSDKKFKYKLAKDFFFSELGTKNVSWIYDKVIDEINKCETDYSPKNTSYRLYYALPSSFFHEFADYSMKAETQVFKFFVIKDFYPHLTVEHLPLLNTIKDCLEWGKLSVCVEQFLENISDNLGKYFYQFSLKLIKITKVAS